MLTTRFRRSFVLERVPGAATLQMRASRNGALVVNGTKLVPSVAAGTSGKEPLVLEVARYLKSGDNRIEVAVGHDQALPALWLWLEGDGVSLVSDATWEASYAGATWLPAQRADRPLGQRPGHWLALPERPLASFRERWPLLLGMTLLSAGLVLAGRRWLTGDGPPAAPGRRWRDPSLVVLVAALVVWAGLMINNAVTVPVGMGFDAQAHRDYIQFLLQRRALPLASDGLEMYNPPLYYALAALVLGPAGLEPGSDGGVMVLRMLNLAMGLGQLVLVWRSLWLLFPERPGARSAGMVLAACLPAQLYLANYVTNELLVSVLVTAALYLTLRTLQRESPGVRDHVLVGLVLGAALLTKFTALLAVPPVLVALAWPLVARREWRPAMWLRTLGTTVAVCLLVCGWHYARVWVHFGRPLVGAWEAELGYRWWQPPGFITGGSLLRFGAVLRNPWFAGIHGMADGLYSTLWGDGLCGGKATAECRPPWNYGLMAAGYWLALVPAAIVSIGVIRSGARLVRRPGPVWLLLLGPAAAFALALLRMYLQAPWYCHIKAFYGLLIFLPFCACGALGWDWLARRVRPAAPVLAVLFGGWALTSLGTYWIRAGGVEQQMILGMQMAMAGRLTAAADEFSAAVRANPSSPQARSADARCLLRLQRADEAGQISEETVRRWPEEGTGHHDLALVREAQGRGDEALEQMRLAAALAPDDLLTQRELTRMLLARARFPEAAASARELVRMSISSSEAHAWLAFSLVGCARNPLAGGEPREGLREAQYEIAMRLNPNDAEVLGRAAWLLATTREETLRNGALAVKLAIRACELTPNPPDIRWVCALAAAQAEVGQWGAALNTAHQAQALAETMELPAMAAQGSRLAALFAARKPCRE